MLETALKLIQTEELKKALAGQPSAATGTQAQPTYKLPNLSSFPIPDQVARVPAGQSKLIWDLQIPTGKFAIALKLSTDPYYLGDVVDWRIDGVPIYDQGIQWTIGEVNTPDSILKKFYKRMQFTAYNNDPSNQGHNYEIFCDGIIASLKDESLVDQLVASGAL